METNEVMIDIGKPEDELQSQKDAQAARFGKIIKYVSSIQVIWQLLTGTN